MLWKEAISKRIYELSYDNGYSPNKLAELSAISPSTLQGILSNKVENPSSLIIYKICKTLKIEVKDFFDCDLFDFIKLED